MSDTASNGIDNGFVEVYLGNNILDGTRILRESGNFTDSITLPFTLDVPPTVAPTSSPAPSVSPAPTFSSQVYITVSIQLDEFPVETGWNLTCNNETLRSDPPGTYSSPNATRSWTFPVQEGAQCECIVLDTRNDGICCGDFGNGYYKVYFGENPFDETYLLADGGESFSHNRIPFVAAAPTPQFFAVTVIIQMDSLSSETGWEFFCGNVSRIEPIGTYTNGFELVNETVLVGNEEQCQFRIEDEGGDGISEDGFYRIYLSTEDGNESFLVAEGGDFGLEEEVRFNASLALLASPDP